MPFWPTMSKFLASLVGFMSVLENPEKYDCIVSLMTRRMVSGTQINLASMATSSIDIRLKENVSDGGNQLPAQIGFIRASALLEYSAYREQCTPLTGKSSNTNPLSCEKTLQYIQPDLFVPTPPSSQQMLSTSEASKSVSSPLEATHSFSSLCSNDDTSNSIQKDLFVPTSPSSQQMLSTSEASKSVSRPLEVTHSFSSLCSNDDTSNSIQTDLFVPTPPSSQQKLPISEISKSISRPLEVAHSFSSLCSNDMTRDTIRANLLIPTPPSSQQMLPISETSKSVSRPLEIAHSSSSLYSNDSDITMDDSDGKLLRILTTLEDMIDRCRVCWVSREVSHPHVTFRCPTKVCSGSEWKSFKSELKFPRGVICYFCFGTFGPPFNHAQAPPGTRQSPEQCEYPDALKELAYILYHDQSLRGKIFSNLGVYPPTTLPQYKQYITKKQVGGILGVYKVIDAYLGIRLRESE